jgi:hypothetical protein
MDEKEPTVTDILKGFPGFIANYLLGFLWGGLCDVTLTSLWLGSAALGYATSWPLGVAAFFFGHFSIRAANARGQAIVRAGREVRMPLRRIADLMTPPADEDPSTSEPDKDETPLRNG